MDALDPQTRQAMQSLLAQIQQRDTEIAFKQAFIHKLKHEMAVLKRMKFAATSERFASTLALGQRSLLDEETLHADVAELGREIEREQAGDRAKDKTENMTRKRTPLPRTCRAATSRTNRLTAPAKTPGCGRLLQRFGERVAGRLDCQPGVLSVDRDVRGKWACRCCQRIVRAPVPAHVIDKDITTPGLLAHLLVARFRAIFRYTARKSSSSAPAT